MLLVQILACVGGFVAFVGCAFLFAWGIQLLVEGALDEMNRP